MKDMSRRRVVVIGPIENPAGDRLLQFVGMSIRLWPTLKWYPAPVPTKR